MKPADWASVATIAAGVALRAIYLDSDPQYVGWGGYPHYITDEGRWIEVARSLTVSGIISEGFGFLHVIVAPVFAAANFVVFQVVGVSFASSRALTALLGAVMLVAVWQTTRRVVSAEAAFLATALVAFQSSLIALSRLAIPEVPALATEVLLFWCLVTLASRRDAVVAGILTLLSVGMKLTTAPVVLAAVAILVWAPRDGMAVRERWRLVLTYGLTLATAPALGIAAFLTWVTLGGGSLDWAWVASSSPWTNIPNIVSSILNFVSLTSLRHVASVVFEGEFSRAIGLWALGLWACVLARPSMSHSLLTPGENRYVVTALIWLVTYGGSMLAIEYFPDRYHVHLLIPLVMCIACGANLFQRVGIDQLLHPVEEETGLDGFAWRGVLTFPTAIFLAPVLVQLLEIAGGDVERLQMRAVAIAVAAGMLAAVLHLAARGGLRLERLFLFFPLIASAIVLAVWAVDSSVPFWPRASETYLNGAGLLLAAGTALVASRWPRLRLGRSWVYATLALAASVSLLSAASEWKLYGNPRYSIKESSQDLGELFSECTSIGFYQTESMAIENNLRYSNIGSTGALERLPDCFLTFIFLDRKVDPLIEEARFDTVYERVRTYLLYVSPDYCLGLPASTDCRVQLLAFVRRDAGTSEEVAFPRGALGDPSIPVSPNRP